MAITCLDQNNFTSILKNDKPVLVDFYADWCGPCKMAEPVIEELAETYKDKLIIAKLNVDQHSGLAAQHQVMSIPTSILFKNSKEVGRIVGFSGQSAFEDLIKKAL